MRVRTPPPIPALADFFQFFHGLFGAGSQSAEPALLVDRLVAAQTPVFTGEEVKLALGRMAVGKTAGASFFSADVFRGSSDSLYSLLAFLFTEFAAGGYPRALNSLLLLPLYKQRGDRDRCDCYRPIALLPPIGRLFSKCLEARLGADP